MGRTDVIGLRGVEDQGATRDRAQRRGIWAVTVGLADTSAGGDGGNVSVVDFGELGTCSQDIVLRTEDSRVRTEGKVDSRRQRHLRACRQRKNGKHRDEKSGMETQP